MGRRCCPKAWSAAPPDAIKTIAKAGRRRRCAFADKLDPAQIAALVQYVYTPSSRPRTGRCRHPRVAHRDAGAASLPQATWAADPLNLFVVVEGGDHHVSLVDGDRFEVIHRFASRYALHGGPKFTPDGRYVVSARATADHQVRPLEPDHRREVRAGLTCATSGLGRRPLVMAANYCRARWRCSTPT